jgi:hypothetical protein
MILDLVWHLGQKKSIPLPPFNFNFIHIHFNFDNYAKSVVLMDLQSMGKRSLNLMDTVNEKKR